MNQKNSLGLDNCFLDTNDPIELFKIWMNKAKETEPNDPNALSLATSDKKGYSFRGEWFCLKILMKMDLFFIQI